MWSFWLFLSQLDLGTGWTVYLNTDSRPVLLYKWIKCHAVDHKTNPYNNKRSLFIVGAVNWMVSPDYIINICGDQFSAGSKNNFGLP